MVDNMKTETASYTFWPQAGQNLYSSRVTGVWQVGHFRGAGMS